jgi:hypothetical protein
MTTSPADRLVSENLKDLASEIGQRLIEITGESMGFSLVVFNATPGSRLNYVSNCSRPM